MHMIYIICIQTSNCQDIFSLKYKEITLNNLNIDYNQVTILKK